MAQEPFRVDVELDRLEDFRAERAAQEYQGAVLVRIVNRVRRMGDQMADVMQESGSRQLGARAFREGETGALQRMLELADALAPMAPRARLGIQADDVFDRVASLRSTAVNDVQHCAAMLSARDENFVTMRRTLRPGMRLA
jgi:hypothetical protein